MSYPMLRLLTRVFTIAALLPVGLAHAQLNDPPPTPCSYCAAWNAPQAPFRVYGNTYYVGTRGLGALLITSPEGHVLIDGGLPESAPLILDNIEALGYRMTDVRLILNSHAHYDHAGGLAWLAEASGATVAASPASAPVLEAGIAGPDDPQHAILYPQPPVASVQRFAAGDTLRVGPLALTPHLTPGHTPGGTTWSWTSCESAGEGDDERCLTLVYADSLTPVSAEGYRFTDHPALLDAFARSFDVVESLACDILVAPHPSFTGLWDRLEAREAGTPDAMIDPTACRRYADAARDRLARRLAQEN